MYVMSLWHFRCTLLQPSGGRYGSLYYQLHACGYAAGVSHTWKYAQWNTFLFESSDKSPYWTNPYHLGLRYDASFNFHTYFGQCPNDIYILLHIPLHLCLNYPHTGLTTATAPSGHQMAVVTWDRSIEMPCRIGIVFKFILQPVTILCVVWRFSMAMWSLVCI